jgi:hypothetical protein
MQKLGNHDESTGSPAENGRADVRVSEGEAARAGGSLFAGGLGCRRVGGWARRPRPAPAARFR